MLVVGSVPQAWVPRAWVPGLPHITGCRHTCQVPIVCTWLQLHYMCAEILKHMRRAEDLDLCGDDTGHQASLRHLQQTQESACVHAPTIGHFIKCIACFMR